MHEQATGLTAPPTKCGIKISIITQCPQSQPICPEPVCYQCQPATCPQCGQTCPACPEVVVKNCYNAPNQNARYREYLEYLDRLQGKKKQNCP